MFVQAHDPNQSEQKKLAASRKLEAVYEKSKGKLVKNL